MMKALAQIVLWTGFEWAKSKFLAEKVFDLIQKLTSIDDFVSSHQRKFMHQKNKS